MVHPTVVHEDDKVCRFAVLQQSEQVLNEGIAINRVRLLVKGLETISARYTSNDCYGWGGGQLFLQCHVLFSCSIGSVRQGCGREHSLVCEDYALPGSECSLDFVSHGLNL